MWKTGCGRREAAVEAEYDKRKKVRSGRPEIEKWQYMPDWRLSKRLEVGDVTSVSRCGGGADVGVRSTAYSGRKGGKIRKVE